MSTDNETAKPDALVRIVAIGASAGGLDPLEQFFEAMPANSGVAFVVIQHLAPDFQSMMDELIARYSVMPIHKVEDGMKVEANTIYLNRPRLDMTVENGRFVQKPATRSGGLNLPINTFFTSLAVHYGSDAVGIILSGTGSDGSQGCLAIKSSGGGVFVQEPATAKFESMPLGVINQDIADAVSDPKTLARHVTEFLKENPQRLKNRPKRVSVSDPYAMIFHILRERYGTDFSYYKRATVERRITRRCDTQNIDDLMSYINLLSVDPNEVAALYSDLLIDVTQFFRDEDGFRRLNDTAVKELVGRMSSETPVRVWVSGCSSGEEAYSLAILIAERARLDKVPLNLKVLATDLHARSLDSAGAGIYEATALSKADPELVSRYFESDGHFLQIKGFIRKLVVFSQHNVIKDPPFTKIDLVSCRNLLIYLNDLAQQKALALFHFALKKDGFMFLGPSETVGKFDKEFKTIDQRWRIFQKTRDIRLADSTTLLLRNGQSNPDNLPASQTRYVAELAPQRTDLRRAYNEALKEMLARYAPAGFLMTTDGTLSHIFGNANRLLKLEQGNFSSKVADLLPHQLRVLVSSGIERMRASGYAPLHRSMPVETDTGKVTYSIGLESLPDPEGNIEFLLLTVEETHETHSETIEDMPQIEVLPVKASDFLDSRVRELEADLQATEESLQTTIEELETSNEELQATNEELMASNEELQSTNEELHSVNEELYTVSAEHQRKIEELVELTSDMDHLLKATDIGTIFLSKDLTIRRFTPAASRTFNLIPQDIGRPITHVTTRFESDEFLDHVARVNETGESFEENISVDRQHYLLRVLSYTDENQGIQGMVITVVDITDLKIAENRISDMATRYDQILTDSPQAIICWRDSDEKVIYANERFDKLVGGERIAASDMSYTSLLDAPGNPIRIETSVVRELAPGETRVFHSELKDSDGAVQWWDIYYRALVTSDATDLQFMATAINATARVRHEQALTALNGIDVSQLSSLGDVAAKVIDVGMEYYRLSEGFLAHVEGDRHVIAEYGTASGEGGKLSAGKTRELAGMPCAQVMELDDIVAFTSPGDSGSDDGFVIDGETVQAYIGAPVRVGGQRIGTLGFLGYSSARFEPLAELERDFMRLLVRWFELMAEHVDQSQQLRQRERELQLIFNNVPARIWFKDEQNRILRLNETAAMSMGMTVEEAEKADTYTLFPDTAKQHHEDDLEVLRSQKPSLGLIEEYTPKGGKRGWVSTDKIPYRDPETSQNAVLVVSTDVTNLKERELELAHVNAQLDLQKKSFENLYKRTPVMMHSIDHEGKIIEVSDTWIAKLGRTREEVIGQNVTAFMTPDSQEHAKSTVLPEFWEDGVCNNVAYQFFHKNGHVIDVELSGIVDKTELREEERALAVMVDVTDRNAAFVALEKANADLEHANEGLKKFAYIASHDLQEPLRKIQQFSDMLLTEYSDKMEGDAVFYMDVMRNAASRMRRLIRDLLSFSKATNADIQHEPLELAQIARRAVSDLEVLIEEAGAEVTIEDLPTVSGDEALVLQVFTNLISNAIKYRKEDEAPRVTIEPLADRPGKGFAIEDNGVGIADEDKRRIFDAFSRLHTQTEVDGSGIGLAICQTVCDRLRWTINVKSTVGEGSRFEVAWP